jgi:hypothetical protein
MRKPAILLGLPFIVFLLEIVLPGAGHFQQARAAAPAINSPGFGALGGQANNPRQIQFGLRLKW